MKKLPRQYRDPLIFLSLLIIVPSCIYFISMNFGDQRLHIEKKQWNPAEPADLGIEPQLLKRASEYVEARLPMVRGMVIIRNGRTVHEKYYWKGGPGERDFLHSLNTPILHALLGIAVEKEMVGGPEQSLARFFPDHSELCSTLTISDLLKVRAPLIWGHGPPEYWDLFFSRDRIGGALRLLSPAAESSGPAANFAANLLLAEIINQASAMSVFEFADAYLFAPMGITTLNEMKKEGAMAEPFIGFALRTLDLAKFGYLVMNHGKWGESRIIPRDWAAGIQALAAGRDSFGGWQPHLIGRTQTILAEGEGGQYIVMAPGLDLLVAVSSKSLFPLPENSGYSHLFRLIFTAADAELARETLARDPEDRPYYEPNFVNSTQVPEEIRRFFLDFARDIATQDINRILYHYARGYETKDANRGWLDKLFLGDDDYGSVYGFWRKIFYGGSGDLEFVHIEKLRIDGNRAYLRGNLKYSYANMNEGSFGWFPLENLIKLRGRWLWLGIPDYGAILDRDEYFDAEISPALAAFINDCGRSLIRTAPQKSTDCFSEDFQLNGLQQNHLGELLGPLWKKEETRVHITRVAESGGESLLTGYMDNSLIGSISLPPGMRAVKGEQGWKWSGNGRD